MCLVALRQVEVNWALWVLPFASVHAWKARLGGNVHTAYGCSFSEVSVVTVSGEKKEVDNINKTFIYFTFLAELDRPLRTGREGQ